MISVLFASLVYVTHQYSVKYKLAAKRSKNDARRKTHPCSLCIKQFSPTFFFHFSVNRFSNEFFTIFALSVGCQHKHCQYLKTLYPLQLLDFENSYLKGGSDNL